MEESAVPALIVAATVLLLIECLTIWVHRQALDTPYVERASRQMLEDPKVRSAVAGYLVDELTGASRSSARSTTSYRREPAGSRRRSTPHSAGLRLVRPRRSSGSRSSSTRGRRRLDVRTASSCGSSTAIPTGRPTSTWACDAPLELAARLGLQRQAAAALPADAGRVLLCSRKPDRQAPRGHPVG